MQVGLAQQALFIYGGRSVAVSARLTVNQKVGVRFPSITLELPMPFKLSQKVTLNEGDKVRVSQGPYFPSKSGKKIGMGHHGLGVFVGVVDENAIYVKFGHESPRYIWIGKEHISETTGTVMRPHKIVKVRK